MRGGAAGRQAHKGRSPGPGRLHADKQRGKVCALTSSGGRGVPNGKRRGCQEAREGVPKRQGRACQRARRGCQKAGGGADERRGGRRAASGNSRHQPRGGGGAGKGGAGTCGKRRPGGGRGGERAWGGVGWEGRGGAVSTDRRGRLAARAGGAAAAAPVGLAVRPRHRPAPPPADPPSRDRAAAALPEAARRGEDGRVANPCRLGCSRGARATPGRASTVWGPGDRAAGAGPRAPPPRKRTLLVPLPGPRGPGGVARRGEARAPRGGRKRKKKVGKDELL